MNRHSKQQGLVKLVILLIIALIVLGYLGFDVRKIVESPQVQENLAYAWGITKELFGSLGGIIVMLYEGLISILKELKGILF